MKILVLIGNVPDTTTKIKFNADKTAFDASGVQWIINPWDELALTRAMELKEASGGAIETIVVANVGLAQTEATLRKALAVGADKPFVWMPNQRMPILWLPSWRLLPRDTT